MSDPEVIYWTMPELAALMLDRKTGKPWTTQRMRRWLQREGACFKQGGHWVATEATLVTNFSELLNKAR